MLKAPCCVLWGNTVFMIIKGGDEFEKTVIPRLLYQVIMVIKGGDEFEKTVIPRLLYQVIMVIKGGDEFEKTAIRETR